MPAATSKTNISHPLLQLVNRFRVQSDLEFLVPLPCTPHFVGEWTKADLLEYFGVYGDQKVLSTQIIEAGRLMLRHTNAVCRFLDQWCDIAADFHLISDEPSVLPELPEFREHRHDQAIFNLLINQLKWETGPEDLLHATRCKN